MNFDPDSSDLARFLQKVLEIQLAEPSDQLTEESVKQIALRAGLSEEDWKRVSDRLEGQLQKGRNFLKYENYADAIVELDQAASLAPYRASVLADCGKAHLGHWKATGSLPSRDRAQEMLLRGLEIEPEHIEAAKLLSELKATCAVARRPEKKFVMAISIAAMLAVAVGVLGWKSYSAPPLETLPVVNSLTEREVVFRPEDALKFNNTHDIFGEEFSTEFVNSLDMPFVSVPIYHGDSKAYSINFSVYETRVKDYRHFVSSTNRDEGNEPLQELRWNAPGYEHSDNHPVSFVNWYDARAFCQWLTLKEQSEGKIGANDLYRLPTDHEWSCAVGIGHIEDRTLTPKYKHRRLRSVFPWGIDLRPRVVVGNYLGTEADGITVSTFRSDGFKKPAPVGSFPLSHWGMYDLGGNVWEWCEDHWDVNMVDEKTLRGASFQTKQEIYILSSGRRWLLGNERKDFIGFRCVLERNGSE